MTETGQGQGGEWSGGTGGGAHTTVVTVRNNLAGEPQTTEVCVRTCVTIHSLEPGLV